MSKAKVASLLFGLIATYMIVTWFGWKLWIAVTIYSWANNLSLIDEDE